MRTEPDRGWTGPRQALVIGAGLSGSAVAYSLANRGWAVTVLDQAAGVGAGASGLPVGLAAPHVSPDDNVLSRITRAGVQATLKRAETLLQSGTDWSLSGVLEHNLGGKRRLAAADLNAHPSDGDTLNPTIQASAAQIAAAGLPLGTPALWHGHAGWLRPRPLVAAQLKTTGIQVRWSQKVTSIARRADGWAVLGAQGETLGQAPLLVVASAFDSLTLLQDQPGFAVPLNPLRGQVSFGLMADVHGALGVGSSTSANTTRKPTLPPFPVNGHGSFISGVPTLDGELGWFIGSTFERNCEQAPVRIEDHAANQVRLATLLPDLGEAMKPQFESEKIQGWAGLRCTLPNRLPAVGPIDNQRLPGLWISAGMGARGISLAVLCGELTAACLASEPMPLPPELAKHLWAERYAST
ncbi:FAD-dependent oxidoreductase [Limnohabitans sp. 15K]|uniref:FAD-dependent oxidoreductase n=1 Tax=Limnohabitans sp. 15K TaxID=1100706 RepID=UPI000C1EED13|nr:FAD-dependent oxidoreductase [Limnohabitans sp. 15K]PIT80023.1 FAD-dependent oxidoreductase [Limnohabitans sp. 15K]